jgi:hypothetical protein
VAPLERWKKYYKGEGGGFPRVRAVVNIVSPSCPWLVLTPKVLQLCTNHFVLVWCRSVWVSEACHFFLFSSRSSSTPLYPFIVLRARECAPIPYLPLFSVWDSHLSPSRSWECVTSHVLLFFVVEENTKLCIIMLRKLHFFTKHGMHSVFLLDLKKRWIDALLGSSYNG